MKKRRIWLLSAAVTKMMMMKLTKDLMLKSMLSTENVMNCLNLLVKETLILRTKISIKTVLCTSFMRVSASFRSMQVFLIKYTQKKYPL